MNKAFKPLEGYRVIELGIYAAGPAAGVALADWGADLIKVESPYGDPSRHFGIMMNCRIDDDDNIIYEIENRNKRGIALDLKKERGQEIMHKLLGSADAFITNMRPRALESLKLSYEDLKERYPRLVYGALTGYGQRGPEVNKPGFDLSAYWARGGILREFGEPESDPIPALAAFGDHPTGLFLAGGVAAALLSRTKTGKGCKVDTSLYSAVLWNLSLNIAEANNTGVYQKRSNKVPPTGIMNTYKTREGNWITLMALEYEKFWGPFCKKVIDAPQLADDPRFSTVISSKKNSREQAALIQSEMVKFTAEELEKRLDSIDMVYEVNLRFHEIKEDPQAIENNYIIPFKMRSGRQDWAFSNPVKFNDADTELMRYAPDLGEHNEEVLTELGLSAEEIRVLQEEKVIVSRKGA